MKVDRGRLACGFGVFAACLMAVLVLSAVAQGAPNVVLILTDDQRVGSLSAERTPSIWSDLREPGTRFTRTWRVGTLAERRAAGSYGEGVAAPDEELTRLWTSFANCCGSTARTSLRIGLTGT
jgi:hypothetical protein